jgi:cytochrome c-type biogenesis protein CcmH
MASLVEKYGVKVLAEPPKKGFASLVWIGPFVLLAVGAMMVVVYLRRHTAHQSQSADAAEIDPAVKARVEDELASHRG